MNSTLSTGLLGLLFLSISFSAGSCRTTEVTDASTSNSQITEPQPEASPMDIADTDAGLMDKVRNERWAGDIDGMLQRRYIRALVIYNKTNFFYDGPQTRGISYEALFEFEKFLNRKLNT